MTCGDVKPADQKAHAVPAEERQHLSLLLGVCVGTNVDHVLDPSCRTGLGIGS